MDSAITRIAIERRWTLRLVSPKGRHQKLWTQYSETCSPVPCSCRTQLIFPAAPPCTSDVAAEVWFAAHLPGIQSPAVEPIPARTPAVRQNAGPDKGCTPHILRHHTYFPCFLINVHKSHRGTCDSYSQSYEPTLVAAWPMLLLALSLGAMCLTPLV